jgi:hypothetical protein
MTTKSKSGVLKTKTGLNQGDAVNQPKRAESILVAGSVSMVQARFDDLLASNPAFEAPDSALQPASYSRLCDLRNRLNKAHTAMSVLDTVLHPIMKPVRDSLCEEVQPPPTLCDVDEVLLTIERMTTQLTHRILDAAERLV